MVKASEIYNGKTVLITGDTGFKGSWLSLWLSGMGAEVVGYSLAPPSNPNLFDTLHLQDEIRHIHGNIKDAHLILSVFKTHEPEFVFHLAAQPIVKRSYREPYYTLETNVMGTANVLECIKVTDSVKSCIIVTSDKCYQNTESGSAFIETDPLGGNDPYSASKACAEIVVDAYRKSFFKDSSACSVSSVRAGNVIGGGDWGKDRLVPDCIKSLSKERPIILRSPSSIRPWQYVLEPLYGYLQLATLMYVHGKEYEGAWNFGSNESYSVEFLVDLIIKNWGGGECLIDATQQPHEDKLLCLDSTKAYNLLGWDTIYDIDTAVKRTVDWYKAFYASDVDMYEYSLEEIVEYERRRNSQK